MNVNDKEFEPQSSPGPIEDAYLHRDVHPDEKAEHSSPGGEHAAFPKADINMPEEDLWMYR
ncbi:MAG TPA: hypothetical protein VJA87_03015 [Candidatus Paceibacterota bacterium]